MRVTVRVLVSDVRSVSRGETTCVVGEDGCVTLPVDWLPDLGVPVARVASPLPADPGSPPEPLPPSDGPTKPAPRGRKRA